MVAFNPAFVIDDTNWNQPDVMGDRLQVRGHPLTLRGDLARPWKYCQAPEAVKALDFELIPREQWPDLISKKDREKTWPEDILRDSITGIQTIDQDGLNYCWAYCVAQEIMSTRCLEGHPYVWLAAESLGGPLVNFRNVGGWPEEAMKAAMTDGIAPMSCLNGTEHKLSPSRWAGDWKQQAKKFKVEKFTDLSVANKVFDACCTASFNSRTHAAGFGWWGHAVLSGLRVVLLSLRPLQFGIKIWNNWGEDWKERGMAVLSESKGTPDLGAVFANVA